MDTCSRVGTTRLCGFTTLSHKIIKIIWKYTMKSDVFLTSWLADLSPAHNPGAPGAYNLAAAPPWRGEQRAG
jgi:hypothetical protein